MQALLRDRTAIALAAAAAAIVAALVLMAVAVGSRPLVAAPAPSPVPTQSPVAVVTAPPTLAPTPAPTAPPTVAPTAPTPPPQSAEQARPTTRTAGERMRPFYAEVRQMFPILPAGIVIDFDEPSGTEPNAVFRGLTAAGEPIFAVREDFVLDRGTAAHEIGHAYQKIIERSRPVHIDVLTPYWQFRGFPGTWQQAQAGSQAETGYMGMWITSPIESWAEAFLAAVTLEVKEKTLDYGKTIDPVAMRAFFTSLMTAPR